MSLLNVEFKACSNRLAQQEEILLKQNPLFVGEDHQIDTYFNVNSGRLKLREGNIENALIYYERENTAFAKESHVLLYQYLPDKSLKEILTKTMGIKAVIDKHRRIYFINNVKFHFDTVQGLGTFLEVEAIDKDGSIGRENLQHQCNKYAAMLGVEPVDYCSLSYSDMVLQKI